MAGMGAPRLSLSRLFFAFTCYAIAAGLISFCLHWAQNHPDMAGAPQAFQYRAARKSDCIPRFMTR
jgi:hypothetical protein